MRIIHIHTQPATRTISINARFSQQTRITLVAAITHRLPVGCARSFLDSQTERERERERRREREKEKKNREIIERTILPSFVEIRAAVPPVVYLSRPVSNRQIRLTNYEGRRESWRFLPRGSFTLQSRGEPFCSRFHDRFLRVFFFPFNNRCTRYIYGLN